MPSDRGDDVERPCRREALNTCECDGRAMMSPAQGRRAAIRIAMMSVVCRCMRLMFVSSTISRFAPIISFSDRLSNF
jgi:hypothetical protein